MWTCFFTVVAAGIPVGTPLGVLLIHLGAYSPSLVALWLTARAEGGSGVRALLGRVLQWRVPARWYLFAVGYIPAIKLTANRYHRDRKSTRLNSSHGYISDAVFCLKKKKASVKALVFGMYVVNNFICRGFGSLLEDQLCLIFKLAPSVCRMTFPILASLLVRLVASLPFQLLRLSLATPSRWTPLALSVFLHCVVALLLTLL